MDRWTEIELLVHLAETGSISRTAERLKLSTSSASRYLASLENRLGACLVMRNTRRAQLTDVGRSYLQRARSALEELRHGEAEVQAAASVPAGVLTISASVSFAMHHIAPLVPAYTERFPEVEIHIEASNRYGDSLENHIDLAVRNREFEPDSNIVMRRLARTRRVLVAAPLYLRRHGAPPRPEALQGHKLLIYTHATTPHELRFSREGQSSTVAVAGVLKSNDGQVLRAAALNGLGILIQPLYVVHEDIVAGRLVPVLEDWDLPLLSINVGYASRKHLSAKVRTFIDFMCAHFEKEELDRKWTSRW
ncbi:LysR family transcriptional regulator [Caldimonas tepidiphila]|uniref:LysR family transcriptional regulator n=1 Tax=Caldimonas tepidiphila TaxID=2315841 RepID=UPI000E5C0E6D|nr:LysR family transcriptional regulator [Caldimonas tepidiphila]